MNVSSIPKMTTDEILRYMAPGNFLYVIFGCFGLVSNVLVLWIFAKNREFYFKSYILLASVVIAELISCVGYTILGAFRFIQFLLVWHPSLKPVPCLILNTLGIFGFTAAMSMEFIIAMDRLIFLVFPWGHRYRLGKGYTVAMLFSGWLYPTVVMFFDFYGLRSNGPPIVVCTGLQEKIRKLAQVIHYYINIGFIVATILVYVGIIFVVRRNIGIVWRTNSKCAKYKKSHPAAPHMPPPYHSLMRNYITIQKRVLRVVVVLSMSFILTNMLSMILVQLVRPKLPKDAQIYLIPYLYVPLIINTVDTLVITCWRDRLFRKHLIKILQFWGLIT